MIHYIIANINFIASIFFIIGKNETGRALPMHSKTKKKVLSLGGLTQGVTRF